MPKRAPATKEERLHRIEGQIRGIERMLTENQPTEKVLPQIQAIISSLESLKIYIIKEEMRQNITENLDKALKLLK